jgi:hypothetical protein
MFRLHRHLQVHGRGGMRSSLGLMCGVHNVRRDAGLRFDMIPVIRYARINYRLEWQIEMERVLWAYL